MHVLVEDVLHAGGYSARASADQLLNPSKVASVCLSSMSAAHRLTTGMSSNHCSQRLHRQAAPQGPSCVWVQPWDVAMLKTEQASKEVAAANQSQQTAARSLQQAEEAEAVVNQESRAVDQVPQLVGFCVWWVSLVLEGGGGGDVRGCCMLLACWARLLAETGFPWAARATL